MVEVLDAHALLVFFEKEPGYDKVQAAFVNAVEKNSNLLMTAVNFGEVYYVVWRDCGRNEAEKIEKIILRLPVEIIDVDIVITKEAARFKAIYKISYADCFAAALTKIKKGEILTGDREFEKLKKEIKIRWI
ncbi:MAG: type II toxin-antitoxin system VapC family toxin [Candidatus Aminicenantales bacterium]